MPDNFAHPQPQFIGVSDFAGYYIYFGQANQDPVLNPKSVEDTDGNNLGAVIQLDDYGKPVTNINLPNPPYSYQLYTNLVGSGGAPVATFNHPEFWGLADITVSTSDIWESVEDTSRLDDVARLNPVAGNAAIVLDNTQFRVGDETSNVDFFQTEGLNTYVNSGLIRKNKNLIYNAQGRINQRAVAGSVVLLAGEYGHDRWRGGSGGGTYTFAVSAGVTTFTITAGTVEQVIPGEDVHTGDVVLSWQGEAQAQINGGGFSDSPVTASVIGGTNITIEFQQNGTDDFSLPQLEYGPNPSDFEYINEDDDSRRCRYFYRTFSEMFIGVGTASPAFSVRSTYVYSPMRVPPSTNFVAGVGSGHTLTATETDCLFEGSADSQGRLRITAITLDAEI